MRAEVVVAVAAFGVLAAPSAARGAPHEAVALTYRAPAGCPDEAAFTRAVTSRTTLAVFSDERSARHFDVLLERRGEGFHGRFRIQGTSAVRDLASPHCGDLFDAFVFFMAIAIDPNASLTPSVPPPPPPPPPENVVEEPAPEPSPMPPPAIPKRAPPAKPKPPVWHLAMGSGAYVATGVANDALASAHPFVEYGRDGVGPAPSARLGLVWANGGAQGAPGGSAGAQLTLGLRALALSGCILRFEAGPRIPTLRACGLLEGGVLTVRPFGLADPTSPDRPWIAAGPLLRVEVPVVARLAVGLDAALLFPFERERVYVHGHPVGALVSPAGVRLLAAIVLTTF